MSGILQCFETNNVGVVASLKRVRTRIWLIDMPPILTST